MPTEIYIPKPIRINKGPFFTEGYFLPPIAEDFPLEEQIQDLISIGVLGLGRRLTGDLACAQVADPRWEEGNLFFQAEVLDPARSRVSIFGKPEGKKTQLFGVSTDGLPVAIADENVPLVTMLPEHQDAFALVARREGEDLPELFMYIRQIPPEENLVKQPESRQ